MTQQLLCPFATPGRYDDFFCYTTVPLLCPLPCLFKAVSCNPLPTISRKLSGWRQCRPKVGKQKEILKKLQQPLQCRNHFASRAPASRVVPNRPQGFFPGYPLMVSDQQLVMLDTLPAFRSHTMRVYVRDWRRTFLPLFLDISFRLGFKSHQPTTRRQNCVCHHHSHPAEESGCRSDKHGDWWGYHHKSKAIEEKQNGHIQMNMYIRSSVRVSQGISWTAHWLLKHLCFHTSSSFDW